MIATLVRKDLRHHRGEALFLVGFELLLLVSLAAQVDRLSAEMLVTLAYAIAFIGGFVFSFRTVASDDGTTGMGFLLSLPLTRHQIVGAKFIANWLLTALNCAIVWGGMVAFCMWRDGVELPTGATLATALLLQLLNSSFYVSCALLFNSARAIWVPFPLLVIGINVVINRDRLPALPIVDALPAALPLVPLALTFASLALLALTRHIFGRTAVRHEWV